MRIKIRLDTMSDVNSFVNDMTKSGAKVYLTDKNRDFIVSAKSLLGAVYSMEWDEIWCESAENIYHLVSKYAADE